LGFEGKAMQFRREHNDRAWLAWHSAYLSLFPPKKFPKMEKLMQRDLRGKRREQTPDDMWAIMSSMTQH
jgi:hypothetical protein